MNKRKFKLLLLATICLVACLLVFWEEIDVYVTFQKMKMNRKGAEAEKYARILSHSNMGIDICIKDLDIYGGSTRGWSTQCLLYADNKVYVEQKLTESLRTNSKIRHKIACYDVLWSTTRDKKWLLEMFGLLSKRHVANESPYTIKLGRERLATILGNTENIRRIFDKPPDQDIGMTPDEFEELLDTQFKKSND